MPYISTIERKKYEPSINSMLSILAGGESNWIKGEMFGYFVTRISFGFMDIVSNHSFNSNAFTQGNMKTIKDAADKVSVELKSVDPMTSAGHLNFVISAVYWGYLGKSAQFQEASYGMRAYLTGVIDQASMLVHQSLAGASSGGGTAVMSQRRHILVKGVLQNVLASADHVCHRDHEDVMRRKNGDIWVQDGTLHSGNVKGERELYPHEKITR